MEVLIQYIKACIQPKDLTEFAILKDEWSQEIFDNLKQDGLILSYVKPPTQANMEFVLFGEGYLIRKCIRNVAWLNQDNNLEFTASREPIYRRIVPPPCETVDHVLLIKSFIIELKKKFDIINYLEYGVCTGHSLFNIAPLVNKAYGVDMNGVPPSNHANIMRYTMTTDEFSSKNLPEISPDCAFIDADHKSSSALRDFDNIFKYLKPGGYIFLHDTYPCEQFLLAPNFCNDCYKTPIEIKIKYTSDQLEIFTFPLNPGLTVVRKL